MGVRKTYEARCPAADCSGGSAGRLHSTTAETAHLERLRQMIKSTNAPIANLSGFSDRARVRGSTRPLWATMTIFAGRGSSSPLPVHFGSGGKTRELFGKSTTRSFATGVNGASVSFLTVARNAVKKHSVVHWRFALWHPLPCPRRTRR
jgi:hypothetical protein